MDEPAITASGFSFPYLRKRNIDPTISRGAQSYTVTEEWFIERENRNSFVLSLPYTISERGKTLQLSNVNEQEYGRVSGLTLTYTEQDADIDRVWWTSTPQGLVYHVRRRISPAQTRDFAEYAMTYQQGLAPNGDNISFVSDSLVIAEASWGPGTQSDDSLASDIDSANVDSMSITVGEESIPVNNEAIAVSMGLDLSYDGELEDPTSEIDAIAAQVAGGKLEYKKLFASDKAEWYRTSSNRNAARMTETTKIKARFKVQESDGYGGEGKILKYYNATTSKEQVKVGKFQISIRRSVMTEDDADLMDAISHVGEESETITIGHTTIAAPTLKARGKYKNFPIKTVYVYGGRTIDQSKPRKFMIGGTLKLARKMTFTDTWYTSSSFGTYAPPTNKDE